MAEESANPGSYQVTTDGSGQTVIKTSASEFGGKVDQDGANQKPKGPAKCPNIPLLPLGPALMDNTPSPPKQGGVQDSGGSPLQGGADKPGGDPNKPPIQGGTDKNPDPTGNTPVDFKPGTGTPDGGSPGGTPTIPSGTDQNDVPLKPDTPKKDNTPPPPKPPPQKPRTKIKIRINNDPCKNITSVTNNNDNFVPLTGPILLQFIRRATGNPKRTAKNDLNVIAAALNDTMRLASINNRRRETAFLAQVIMETGYFNYLHELGRGKGKTYGNYYGRGFVHLTWPGTYKSVGKALYKNDPLKLYNNPDLVETDPEVNAAVTAYYWLHHTKPTFNALADAGKFDKVTYHLFGATIHSKSASERRSVRQRDCYHLLIQQLLNQVSSGS